MLTMSTLLMGRIKQEELSGQLMTNALALIEAVNGLLRDLGVQSITVSSGYRTATANIASGGAKRSLHMDCRAVDLLDDKSQTLAKLVQSRPDLLAKYGLWLEDPAFTKGKFTNWLHIDTGNRKDRPSRTFKP